MILIRNVIPEDVVAPLARRNIVAKHRLSNMLWPEVRARCK